MSKERLSCAVNAISGTKWQHELGRAMYGNLLVLPSYLDQAASSRSPSCSPRSRSAPTRASRRSDPASTPPSSRRTFHRRRRPPMTPMAPAGTALAEGRASADAVAGPEVAAAERARQPPFRLSTGKLHFNTAKIADWVSMVPFLRDISHGPLYTVQWRGISNPLQIHIALFNSICQVALVNHFPAADVAVERRRRLPRRRSQGLPRRRPLLKAATGSRSRLRPPLPPR